MILDLIPLPQFIALHVGISLIGIVSGLVALPAMARGWWVPRTQAVFLVTTLLTSLTGFLFPFHGFTPAIGVGAISTVDLVVAFVALFALDRASWARAAYAISATVALWLNLFVLVAQVFQKVAVLDALTPSVMLAAQSLLLIAMLVLGAALLRRAQAKDERNAANRATA
ncbi:MULTISPECIES: hypothetical protein [unclassified Sphingobium]|uniref:hypothetical protein n=1 Tax=unclassified Sphingobium TaxID=2611147 RepID=UPI00077060DA|nr:MULTISPECIES: hypothetical protein [unclassified Sphingobium]AMK24980.1 hypothetical protein K426_20255 [Sphingobium sp. TKS]NML90485.1 hypothetical protein [Sphingobium sp. TB-6]